MPCNTANDGQILLRYAIITIIIIIIIIIERFIYNFLLRLKCTMYVNCCSMYVRFYVCTICKRRGKYFTHVLHVKVSLYTIIITLHFDTRS